MARRVLYIEDNKNWRKAVTQYIRSKTDIEVEVAKNPEEGFEFVRRNHYDALVVDLELGGEGPGEYRGVTFIREIQEAGYTFPILMLSRHLDVRLPGITEGALAFCDKEQHTEEDVLNELKLLLRAHIDQTERIRLSRAYLDSTPIKRGMVAYKPYNISVIDPSTALERPVRLAVGEKYVLLVLMHGSTPRTLEEIAEITEQSPKTVQSYISRIRKKLAAVNPTYGAIDCEATPSGLSVYRLVM